MKKMLQRVILLAFLIAIVSGWPWNTEDKKEKKAKKRANKFKDEDSGQVLPEGPEPMNEESGYVEANT